MLDFGTQRRTACRRNADRAVDVVLLGFFLLLRLPAGAQVVGGGAELTVAVTPEPLVSSVRAVELVAAEEETPPIAGMAITRFFAFADGTSEEDVRISVAHGLPDADLTVEIDGKPVGRIVTDDEGAGLIFLSTHPELGERSLPAALVPVNALRRVVVRDGWKVVILQGDLAEARRRERIHTPENPIGD